MNFEDFIKQKKVIRAHPDLEKSKALVKMANQHFDYIKTIELSDKSASIIFSQSYECIRQILEAIALKNGFKVYSHEAFTYYLVELTENSISEQFDRLRKLRNGIHYYGRGVSQDVAQSSLEKIEKISMHLQQKYLQ